MTWADWLIASCVAVAALFYGYWRGYCESAEDHQRFLKWLANRPVNGGVK